jgi:microcystin-dependent protein
MDPFVAEVRIFSFAFAPRGWAFCNGQFLSVLQNTALFSLLGTTYGGDGRSSFGLPNFQGCVVVHVGGAQPGPGLSPYYLGDTGGTDTVQLSAQESPSHSHTMLANNNEPQDKIPSPQEGLARSTNGGIYQATVNTGMALMNLAVVKPIGGAQPHNNLQPYLTLNFCIALQGVFPSRP